MFPVDSGAGDEFVENVVLGFAVVVCLGITGFVIYLIARLVRKVVHRWRRRGSAVQYSEARWHRK